MDEQRPEHPVEAASLGSETATDCAREIVAAISESLLVLNPDLTVLSANPSFYALFRVTPEEVEGRSLFALGNGQWDRPALRARFEGRTFSDFEVSHDFERIGPRVMLLNARRLGTRDFTLLTFEDVTERRFGMRAYHEMEERFDLFIQNVKEYGIFMMDQERRVTMWNPGAERILGWSEDEIIGELADVIFVPEDRAAGAPEEEVQLALEDGMALDERWHVRKDGTRFWAHGVMTALWDPCEPDRQRGFAKILRDNTARKQAEEERDALMADLAHDRAKLKLLNATLEERVHERTRQVRALASTLTMAEQQERRRISQILHDDLQQQLYGLLLKLGVLRKDAEAGTQDRLLADVAQLEGWLQSAIETTRNLTVDLSPPVLKGEGLVDALEWLVVQMKHLHGLEITLHAAHSFYIPDEDMRVLLFQIIRELLFNVVKHADTQRATIELLQEGRDVAIYVVDEGQGFDVPAVEQRVRQASASGFGLFSVRERLALFGGSIDITSAPGAGTHVRVYTPMVLSSGEAGDAPA